MVLAQHLAQRRKELRDAGPAPGPPRKSGAVWLSILRMVGRVKTDPRCKKMIFFHGGAKSVARLIQRSDRTLCTISFNI